MTSVGEDQRLPGAVLRRVMWDRRVGLMAGQRALMVGALNPLNLIGSTRDARGRREPFARLYDTGTAFETVFYDPLTLVAAVVSEVKRRHRRMRGVLLGDVGPYPAGTRWAADMPELMWWTIAVLMDSVVVLHTLLVGPLSDAELEALWTLGFRRVAILFGTPQAALPDSYATFRLRFDLDLAGEGMFLTEEALYFGRAIALEIPMARWAQLTIRHVHNLILLGSLQPRVRALYKIRWRWWQQALFRLVVFMVRRGGPLLPNRLRTGRCERFFAWPASIEQRRLVNGERTPHLPPLQPADGRSRGRVAPREVLRTN